ncbi:MAG TPA: hypothetical protein VK028_08890 [Micromonosporaceae bacterium]|nr:hypothetical protein [Micromonosporaceae bacterium]
MAEQSLRDWARTANFSYPVRWGEVESAILARDLPPLEQEVTTGRFARVAVVAAAAVVGALVYGASVVGLGLVAVGAYLAASPGPWMVVAQIAFIVATLVPVTVLMAWWTERRRGPWDVLVSGLTAAASIGAFVILTTLPEESDAGWLGTLTLVAAVVALAVFLVILAASKGGPRARRRAWSLNPGKDLRYIAAREEVLQVLVERRLVQLDKAGQRKVLEMPLGSWHELDESPRD